MEYALRQRTGRDLKHHLGFTESLIDLGTPLKTVPVDEYKSMEAAQRSAYDANRRKVITRGLWVKNDSFLKVQKVLARVMREHQYRCGGGHGVLVSADSYMGKTTVAMILMHDILVQCLAEDPDCLSRGQVPVAYINLPSSGTPLGLYRMLAYFYGLPIGKRETEAILEGMVQHAVNASGTELLVIDDVHNLKYGGPHSAKVSAAIRRLGDDINCPILLAGIALETTSLLVGLEGAQIFQRYRSAAMSSYDTIGTKAERDLWRRLVKGFVTALPLFGDNAKEAGRLADELHHLTGGRIGDLNSILSRVSLDLIDACDPEAEVISAGLAQAKAEEILEENSFKEAVRRKASLRAAKEGRSHAA